MPILAHVFEEAGRLGDLEGFTSEHGPAFYRLDGNQSTITLDKGPVWTPPRGRGRRRRRVTVFDPGFPLEWRVRRSNQEGQA